MVFEDIHFVFDPSDCTLHLEGVSSCLQSLGVWSGSLAKDGDCIGVVGPAPESECFGPEGSRQALQVAVWTAADGRQFTGKWKIEFPLSLQFDPHVCAHSSQVC